ncbi:MAG: hypothetical protein RIC85_00540 [Gammaproteobacteria bacterium]
MLSFKVKLGLLAVCVLVLTGGQSLRADFTFVVPQKPGGGTSVWATVVADALEPHLGEKIVIRHIPGARNKVGFEEFDEKLQFDDKTVMISHGGNAVSYLLEDVTYDYRRYEPIAIMNNNIVVISNTSLPDSGNVVFAERSGTVPESLALAMLFGWDTVKYVKGMSSAETRAGFLRDELTVTRENPAAYGKYFSAHVAAGKARILFNHGLFRDGRFAVDPNFPPATYLSAVYRRLKNAEITEHPLYPSYLLVTAWRDGLQKAMWVGPDNPNAERLRKAVKAMLSDEGSRSLLMAFVGDYPWHVGADASAYLDSLMPLLQERALADLVDFTRDKLKLNAVLKTELAN